MDTTRNEKADDRKPTTKGLIRENILNMEFFFSVVIPIALFSAFDHYKMTLNGTMAAGGWSLGMIIFQYIRDKRVNVFAAIGAIFSAIGLVGAVVSRNPMYYLASPIVIDLLQAIVFFGSVVIGKPLIQMLAEYTIKKKFSEEFRRQAKFKKAWVILTVAWGVLAVTQALLRIVLLRYASNEVYYAVSSIYGSISTPLMLAVSFWFPGWYWKHKA